MSTGSSDLDRTKAILARLGLHRPDAPQPSLLDDDETLESPQACLAQALRERYHALTVRHSFKPGDLVTWKAGLQNRRYPSYGAPAIVVTVLDEVIHDAEESSGCTYFREPLDVVVGVFVEEGELRGEFLVWYLNSQRLAPWHISGE